MPDDKRLLYGLYSLHQNFAIWPEAEARERADDIAAIRSCGTVGELRELAPTLRREDISGWIEEDYEDDPDDAPWDATKAPGAEDGDWPGIPTQYALDAFDEKFIDAVTVATGAREVETIFNGPYLDIPASAERELVAVLASLGYQAVRDDATINELGNN